MVRTASTAIAYVALALLIGMFVADRVDAASPSPAGGLGDRQMGHATTIVEVGQRMGLPRRAYVVAIATAMQESRVSVLANTGNPRSFDYPGGVDGQGKDHDSVGIFQQRPKYWCPDDLFACMEPASSARKFYSALQRVDGWQSMPVTRAAQAVQGSAYPNAYAKHVDNATDVVDEILGWQEAQRAAEEERKAAEERERKAAEEEEEEEEEEERDREAAAERKAEERKAELARKLTQRTPGKARVS